MKTVLFFQASFCDSNQRQLAGVYDFARKAGWNVQVVEYGATFSKKRKPDVNALKAFWNPDGCIVDCGGAVEVLKLADFGKTPTVFLDRHPASIEKGAVCVASDSAAIAKIAARELLSGGFAAYAYVDWYLPIEWSDERGDAFERIVVCNGKRFFRHRMKHPEGKSILDEIHGVRIERAKQLLREGRKSVGMVSDTCGYASVVDFRRTFKRITGRSPREWLIAGEVV